MTKDKDRLNEFSGDIEEKILQFDDELRIRANTKYLIGMSSDNSGGSLIAWYNNQLFHTAPLSLNLIHNAILRAKLGSDYSIQVSNWPVPFKPESETLLTMNGDDMGNQLATRISFAMAFITAFYVIFYIRERTSKAKLLQFISGVKASIFWVISFLFDFATYILISLVFIITMYAFHEEHWSMSNELMELFIVLIVFGLSSLPITYVLSFLFSHASYGFVSSAILFVFSGKFQ